MYASASALPTVLHIEDNLDWTNLVAFLLSQYSEVQHLGYSTSEQDGVRFCREQRPSIVLLDLWLPDADGFRIAAEIFTLPAPPQVLLMSCREDDVTLYRAWSDPFAGLILKSENLAEHLRPAITTLLAGRRYFSPNVLERIQRLRRSPNAFDRFLSISELALADAFVRGDSNEVIAAEHGISRHTAHSHRTRLMRKLNLHSLEELIAWGARTGFGNRIFPSGG